MLKDSVAQAEEKARLEWMLQRAEEDVARLRAERSRLPVDSLEWVWADEALFDARCEVRRLKAALRMAGSLFECERCGAIHNPEWVAAYGLRCDAECDGRLREVAEGQQALEAISLYREYVEKHDYDPERAAAAAALEVDEGQRALKEMEAMKEQSDELPY